MKILFCNPQPITKERGGSKVTVELSEAMSEIGWDCNLVGSNEVIAEAMKETSGKPMPYREALRFYLKRHARKYDVIDFDHEHLPYPRLDFDQEPLFVARSVLLLHHLECIFIPQGESLKSKLGVFLKGNARKRLHQSCIKRAQETIESADLVNVSNEDDKAELVRRGISASKIIVIPYGISASRRHLFDAVSTSTPEHPIVAFVGSFDYRKGAKEFPKIVQNVVSRVPDVRFRLLGTGGMFTTEAAVLANFPKHLRERVEVIPRFSANKLPEHLASCSVGIFPSYIEGFGFGVLEMLAASLPVIAYDSPGPPMMLPPEYLVPRGDAAAMSQKVIALLQDTEQLASSRLWAHQRSKAFDWGAIAKVTGKYYQEYLDDLRPSNKSGSDAMAKQGAL
jgi:glycosyltransferase involved in cell wall biosynthesis